MRYAVVIEKSETGFGAYGMNCIRTSSARTGIWPGSVDRFDGFHPLSKLLMIPRLIEAHHVRDYVIRLRFLSQDESLNLQIHEEAGLTAQPRDFVAKVGNPPLLSGMEQFTQQCP